MINSQHEAEGSGEKDLSPLPNREKNLLIIDDIIAAYKKLLVADEPDFEKLVREMTKPFVTCGTIRRKLNRLK